MNNPLVQPDPGLFIWTIVTFLVLLALLGKFAWRPLRLSAYRNGGQKRVPMRLWAEHRPRRSRTGGTDEQYSAAMLS